MKTSTKIILWKIYFWFVLLNALFVYPWQAFSRIWEIFDLIIFSSALMGLFAFVWKKNIFNKFFWKTSFVINLVWNIFYMYFLPLPDKFQETFEVSQFVLSTASIIFYIPSFFALYLYAFSSSEIKNVLNNSTSSN